MLVFAAGCIVWVGALASAEVSVTEVEYGKWPGAWKIGNGKCQMIIVPQVGRVMSFSLTGGPNLLWNNPAILGQTVPKDDNTWHNFGGDKVWPTQQDWWIKYTDRNGWPPPYSFDGAAQSAQRIEGGVRMTSPKSPEFGTRTIREFVMDRDQPLVRVRQWFAKEDGKPVTMSLWTVSQVRTPDYALLPAVAKQYKPLGEVVPDALKQSGGAVSIRNNRDKPQKIGVAPDKDAKYNWVAAVFANVTLVESRLVRQGQYPDGNCPGEIYTAPARDGSYVELEMLSPMTDLKPGQTLRDDAVWQIVRLDDPRPPVEKAAAAARSAHEAAVRELSR
jgi:hypothetical protein